MTNRRQTAHRTFAENFLGLPKELRELIYAGVFDDLKPVVLEDAGLSLAGKVLLALGGLPLNPDFVAEVFEAFYTYSIFSVQFPEYQDCARYRTCGDSNSLCTCSWLPQTQHYRHIRSLIVYSHESDKGVPGNQISTLEALEDVYSERHYRHCFELLLLLPRLEHLTINLEKKINEQLAWPYFTPVLSMLRERSPKFRFRLSVSFDDLLQPYWNDPFWENATEPGNVNELPFDPMGFVDITELVEAPTEEDIAYVEEHCPGEVRTPGQNIVRGLLDETASHRRALALHYVVKEPALLRVCIKEHYEVYKRMKQGEVAATKEGSQT